MLFRISLTVKNSLKTVGGKGGSYSRMKKREPLLIKRKWRQKLAGTGKPFLAHRERLTKRRWKLTLTIQRSKSILTLIPQKLRKYAMKMWVMMGFTFLNVWKTTSSLSQCVSVFFFWERQACKSGRAESCTWMWYRIIKEPWVSHWRLMKS